jgi:hypothetical protein
MHMPNTREVSAIKIRHGLTTRVQGGAHHKSLLIGGGVIASHFEDRDGCSHLSV